jgi:hypothetical protein
MNFVESQNILLVLLKIFGFFPINFGGKYKKFKNHFYNFCVSVALIAVFTIVGYGQLNQGVIGTVEKESVLLSLAGMSAVFLPILCFVIIKLHLLVKSDVQENYFDALGDLEIMMRSHHVRNKKVEKIIEDLRKSTLQQEIFLFVFYLLIEFGYGYVAVTDNLFLNAVNGLLYDIFNCFFVQILIFLKMNMNFAKCLQSHLNQVLLNRQMFQRNFNVLDFIKIHRKIKQCLEALNEAFGFVFLITFVAIYGSMISQIYNSVLTLVKFSSGIPMNLLFYTTLNFIWGAFSYYYLGQFAFECDKMQDEVIFDIEAIETVLLLFISTDNRIRSNFIEY